MVPPEKVVFGAAVTNETDEFHWQGTVDGSGLVTEQLAPEDIHNARDTALSYLSKLYGEEAPEAGLTWTERYVVPELLVGSGIYFYTVEDWVVTISFPVVPPEMVVYHVAVVNQTSGFGWGGWVDETGRVAEATDSVLAVRDAPNNSEENAPIISGSCALLMISMGSAREHWMKPSGDLWVLTSSVPKSF